MKEIRKFFEKLKNELFNIKYWISHRTYNKYHIVKLGTKPGYSDVCHRMPIAIFELLRVFVEKEAGLEGYLEYKSGLRFDGKYDEQYEEWVKGVEPVYDALYKAYMFWQANREEYIDNEFGVEEENEKKKEMTEHLINVVKYHAYLWV